MSDVTPASRHGIYASAVLPWTVRVVAAAASIVFIVATVPGLAPAALGLDGSWRMGLTMGTLQHLQFGRDIVFTFGPLGYVLEGIPTPDLAMTTMCLQLLLAVVAVAGAWTVCAGRSSILMKAAFLGALLITAVTLSVDYLAFAGIVALLARAARFPRLEPMVAVLVGATGVFGLLSKQTLGLDVLAPAGAFYVAQLIVGPRRRRIAAALSLITTSVVVAAGMLWAFGGSAGAVASYARNSAEVIAGYSAAMSSPGPASLVVAAVAIGFAIVASAVLLAREGKAPLAAAIFVALFLAWKHGFVREDGHVIYFFAVAPLLAALVGTAARRTRTLMVAAIATLGAYGGAGWMLATYNINVLGLISQARLATNAENLLHPVASARAGQAASATVLEGDRLSPDVRARIGAASVDVIPAETAIVAVNGLRWMPLPVFQSYSAYTPGLDELDRAAVADRGPDVELMRYEDVDLRYPLSSEPATFAELLCRYRVADWTATTPHNGSFIVLLRQPASRCTTENLGTIPAGLNRPIDVPLPRNPNDVVRASFDVRPTLLGSAAGLLWRPPFVWIEATFRNGETYAWRLVSATARDGVIVSPMPRSQDEARGLFAGDPPGAASVKSVRLVARDPFYRLTSVTFTSLHR